MILRRAVFGARHLLRGRGRACSHRALSTHIPSKPIRYHAFGIAKVLAVSAPFLWIGQSLAAKFASYLEEFDFFVPDDDDD